MKRHLRPLARRAPMSCQLRRPPPVTSQPTQKLGSSFQSISAQWRFAVGVKSAVRLSCVLWFGCTINSSLEKHHRRSGCGRSCGRLQIICHGPAADADTFSMQSKLDIRPKLHKAVFASTRSPGLRKCRLQEVVQQEVCISCGHAGRNFASWH